MAVTNWVTYHGFALNVNSDLSYFGLIRPCGLDPGVMTSMKELTGSALELDRVKREVVGSFLQVFEMTGVAGQSTSSPTTTAATSPAPASPLVESRRW